MLIVSSLSLREHRVTNLATSAELTGNQSQLCQNGFAKILVTIALCAVAMQAVLATNWNRLTIIPSERRICLVWTIYSICGKLKRFLKWKSVTAVHLAAKLSSPWARKWKPSPPSGIFVAMHHFKASPKGIWKMHVWTWLVGGCSCAATFFSSAKNHRLPTPRGYLPSSETPLPTKSTLKVIWGQVFLISYVSWNSLIYF